MKTPPQEIFLQFWGDQEPPGIGEPLYEVSEVSWCWEKIFPADVSYLKNEVLGHGSSNVWALRQTCAACPSQWEGVLGDGRFLYIRYRHGSLEVGCEATLSHAIGNRRTVDTTLEDGEVGDGNGWISLAEVVRALPEYDFGAVLQEDPA